MSEFDQKKDPITLTRLLLRDSKQLGASGDFAILLQSIQLAVKVISSATSKAGISNLYGSTLGGAENSSGDVQKKLDILANDVFVNALSFCDMVAIMGSEENEEPYMLQGTKGKYSVVFDPLDGSSNIDNNVGVGSIWAIYKHDPKNTKTTNDPEEAKQLLLKPGRQLISAGYAVYGPSTLLVLATSFGVNVYTLDPTIGEFILTQENARVPENGSIYSINEGNALFWDKPTRAYVHKCKERQNRARYIGSMVSDVHRTLTVGGIFAYPGDEKAKNGKLRLLYEVNPMSFIIEKAGGKCTTGTASPLDITPTELHQRCPIWLGSAKMVEEVEQLYKELE
jgi:fructose-1,6-bisphosphatase I